MDEIDSTIKDTTAADHLDDVRAGSARLAMLTVALRQDIAAAKAAGASWAQIGDALGTTKQAAWERYGK